MDIIYILYILYFVAFLWGLIALVMAVQIRIEHNTAKKNQKNDVIVNNTGEKSFAANDFPTAVNSLKKQNSYEPFHRISTGSDMISVQRKNKFLAAVYKQNKSDYYKKNLDIGIIYTVDKLHKTPKIDMPYKTAFLSKNKERNPNAPGRLPLENFIQKPY